jgi:hypothetical protein
MTAVHHPAPINQFYKLDYDEVHKRYVKTTRWNHIHADAAGRVINWDSKLCMAGGGAVNLDAHTGGTKRTSPGRIHDFQFDMSGGIGVDDVKVSWDRGWNEALYTPDWFNWADTIYQVRARRRACEVAVDYGRIPYEYQQQKGGDFPHALVIEDYRSTDSRIKVYDTLGTNPIWMPQNAVRYAAEAIAISERGTRERLFVAFTRVRPLLDTVQLYRAVMPDDSLSTRLYSRPYVKSTHSVSTATYIVTRHSAVNPATGKSQWWYQILPSAATANRGLWISPSRSVDIKEIN